MSRIHEALKKAEQERASREALSEQVDVGRTGPSSKELMSTILELDGRKPSASSDAMSKVEGPLNFEFLAKRCSRLDWRIDPEMTVFESGENGSEGAERFRTLRSRLFQIASTRTLRRVLITSSVPAEGKSFIAANLAHSLACRRDSRVLLVDGDLRASRLHSALGAPRAPGLTNYLRGEVDEFAVIQVDKRNNLAFLPSGDAVADASELILGERMKQLLDLVTPAFDWVILDSPPALAVHDASLFADLCDGLLFVVKAGETSYENALKASSEFREKKLLGVVLNQIEKRDMHAGNSDYAYEYGRARK